MSFIRCTVAYYPVSMRAAGVECSIGLIVSIRLSVCVKVYVVHGPGYVTLDN